MTNVKKTVKKYRTENGFIGNETNKDLIFYLLKKHDDLDKYVKDQFKTGQGKIATNRTKSNMNWNIIRIILGSIITNWVATILVILNLVGVF